VFARAATGPCIALCGVPRDKWKTERGWPFTSIDLAPCKFFGHLTPSEVRDGSEKLWRAGSIGPNGTGIGEGRFVFKIGHGGVFAVKPLALCGDVLSGCAGIVCGTGGAGSARTI
jgi:hypothetical protein